MRVLIVGAGPAGAALSLLLARNGIEVVLIERERDAARVFRGEALMPSGLGALYQMGLRDAVLGLPTSVIECWSIHLNRRPTLRIDEPIERLGDLAFRAVSQPALLEMLVEQAATHDGFEFLPGHTVRGLLRSDDGPGGRVCGVRCYGEDGEYAIEGDLVVGCDGRGSMVRHRAELPLTLLRESYDVLWLKTVTPPHLVGRTPIEIYAAGPDVALTYVSWDQRWQIAWMLPKGSWNTIKQQDWLADCAQLMPPATADHLLAHRDQIEGPSLLDVIVGCCPAWHDPGLLLLGDAAHPMSPVRAQGINMALRDAVVAANHLVPALTNGAGDSGEIDRACTAVQREREVEIHRVQTLQIREVRGQRWAREKPWLMTPLLKVAPAIAKLPFIAPLWLRQQKPLRFGVTDVQLEV